MTDFVLPFVENLLANPYVFYSVGALIVLVMTQLLKQPIKLITKHISSARVRKLVNLLIVSLPFILGILVVEPYYNNGLVAAKFIPGITYAFGAIVFYNIIERFFAPKLNLPKSPVKEPKKKRKDRKVEAETPVENAEPKKAKKVKKAEKPKKVKEPKVKKVKAEKPAKEESAVDLYLKKVTK